MESHTGNSSAGITLQGGLLHQKELLPGLNEASKAHYAPLITGAGILAHLECKVARSVEIGDHTVIFAEVMHIDKQPSTTEGKLEEDASKELALLYYDKKYAPINREHIENNAPKRGSK
jgi:flavin reductase (DIM6/NTAB) family NADH-FMN oxidoreductase RutF